MAKSNKVAQVSPVNTTVEVEETVTPAKVLVKGESSSAPRKSAFAKVQTASSNGPDQQKGRMVNQISYYVYFMLKTFCSNKKHANKDVVDKSLLECDMSTLQEFRDYLFQNISVVKEIDGYSKRVLIEGVDPQWESVPASLQSFIEAHVEDEYNYKMLALLLTQARPDLYTGKIQPNTQGLFRILENKPEVVSALGWWADVGYPNIDEIQSEAKRTVLQDMYDNKFARAAWWGREGVYMQYVDRDRSDYNS